MLIPTTRDVLVPAIGCRFGSGKLGGLGVYSSRKEKKADTPRPTRKSRTRGLDDSE